MIANRVEHLSLHFSNAARGFNTLAKPEVIGTRTYKNQPFENLQY